MSVMIYVKFLNEMAEMEGYEIEQRGWVSLSDLKNDRVEVVLDSGNSKEDTVEVYVAGLSIDDSQKAYPYYEISGEKISDMLAEAGRKNTWERLKKIDSLLSRIPDEVRGDLVTFMSETDSLNYILLQQKRVGSMQLTKNNRGPLGGI